MLWLFMPDYPSTNPEGINYFKVLWSIVTLVLHEPVLVQACLTGAFTSMTFTSFWTTLTFLLSSTPYNYSPLTIGLFALIGILGLFFGPPVRIFRAIFAPFVLFFEILDVSRETVILKTCAQARRLPVRGNADTEIMNSTRALSSTSLFHYSVL